MSLLISSLKQSLEFLNIVIDTIPTSILIVDKNFRIQSFNNSLSLLFQKSDEKLLNQLCGNAIGCAYEVEANLDCGCTQYCGTCSLRNAITRAFNQNEIIDNEILKRNFYINNENILKYFRFSVKPILVKDESFVIIFLDDVTELYEISQKRNELLGIAAHDIRNPLTIIKLYIDFIKSHSKSKDTKINQAFESIDNSLSYILELLNDILSFASFENSEIKIQYIKVDYIEFVKNIVNLQQMIASEKKIKIIFNSSINSLHFQFDSNKITQVLNNLISNAIKYSFENSTIQIKISIEHSKEMDYVKTEIIDNGPGIDIKEQEKLFKPFSRTSVKPTKNESSTGLGLAIAKSIVNAHKGEIGVISYPSKGSNFWFTLPILY